nr:hypothetical protein [Streptomyces sp. 846.5]
MVPSLTAPNNTSVIQTSAISCPNGTTLELGLQVLAFLPFLDRFDAVPVLRRYAASGVHWAATIEAIQWTGSLKLADVWDGLDQDVLVGHNDAATPARGGCRFPTRTADAGGPRRGGPRTAERSGHQLDGFLPGRYRTGTGEVVSSVHRENCRSGGLVCAGSGVLGLVGGGCPW